MNYLVGDIGNTTIKLSILNKSFKIIKIYKVSIQENKKLIDERYHCILRKN